MILAERACFLINHTFYNHVFLDFGRVLAVTGSQFSVSKIEFCLYLPKKSSKLTVKLILNFYGKKTVFSVGCTRTSNRYLSLNSEILGNICKSKLDRFETTQRNLSENIYFGR